MGNTEPVVKEITIDAPASRVWKALTDPEQIVKWLMPPENFKLEVGNKFKMEGNNKGRIIPHFCKIIEIVPERKLSYTWAVENMLSETLVTYEIENLGETTKLTLTHSGWDKVTLMESPATRADYSGGWEFVIPGLKKYIENN